MANIMAQKETVDKLIENSYLHSNTGNFVANSNAFIRFERNNKTQSNFIQLLNKIETYIYDMLNRVNYMYNDLGILERDSWSPDTGYSGAGSKKFKEMYLVNNLKYVENSNEELHQRILKAINSSRSIEILQQIIFDVTSYTIRDIDLEPVQDILNQLENVTGQVIEQTSNIASQDVAKYINNLFNSNEHNGRTTVRLKQNTNNVNINQDIQKLLQSLNLQGLSITNNRSVEKIRSKLQKMLIEQHWCTEIAKTYYWQYIIRECKFTVEEINREEFISIFSQTLMQHPFKTFISKNSTIAIKGFTLEFGMSFSLGFTQLPGKVELIGQNLERRIYTNKQKNNQGSYYNQVQTKIYTTQSGSDMIFRFGDEKSGYKEYRLQLKNDLLNGDSLGFNAKKQIKISTFVPMAIDDAYANILIYLLINAGFLKKYGLNAKGQPNKLKISRIPTIERYIIALLETAYKFILGTDYEVLINNTYSKQRGNVAYIFQGVYIIPIAMYFAAAYDLLKNIFQNNKETQFASVQITSFSKVQKELFSKDSGINAIKFQEEKHQIIQNMKSNNSTLGEYKYPQQLLQYGSDAGRSMYNNLAFSLQVKFQLDKLEKILER